MTPHRDASEPADGTPDPVRRRPLGLVAAAAAGLVAAAVALGVAELVAGTARSFRSPVLDVGDRVVDLVPPPVKDLAIAWFGTSDKVALLVGIGLLLALAASVLGMVAQRRPAVGALGVGLFGVVGAAAVLGDRAARPAVAVLPAVLGAATGAGALLALVRVLPPGARRPPAGDDAGEPEDPTGTAAPATPAPGSRRAFLVVAGGLGAAAAGAAVGGRWLGSRFSAAASRAAVVLPRVRRPLPPVPAAASVAVAGVSPFITPNRDFYRIDTALVVPQVPLDSWRLRVSGMVGAPFELTYGELLDGDLVEADITMTCVSNEVGGQLVGTARWTGVRLDELVSRARPDDDADQVVGRSVDGYTCGFPVAALDGREALVAVAMNGEPLPLRHGFPARLIVPGLYGYVSATKWLTEIELTRFDRFEQYWVPRGWAAQAPIKVASRIDTPRGLARVAAGTVPVAGVAWAQTRGIAAVQVRVDDGPWLDARLAEAVGDDTWRQWWFPWDATPGRHTVAVRAVDGTGAIQTEERSEPMPDGSTGHHRIVVTVA